MDAVTSDDHVRGAEGAELELVMYGDFECPYCAAAQGIVARVVNRLGDRLRFVFRHFPLDEVHPHASHAAQASEAAAAQGDFWGMHDALYAARGRLEDADLAAHARGLGLDGDAVAAALADGRHAARVDARSRLRPAPPGSPARRRSSPTAGSSRALSTPDRWSTR